ncbi:MAG: sugar ABC transporter permease [Anaerolineae bacterium]
MNKPHALSRLFAREHQGYLFVLPALILFLLVLAFPIGYAIYLSFFKVNPDFSLEFIGWQNFVDALQDEYFWNAFKNTFIYTAISVTLHLLIGMGLALALNNTWFKGRKLLRVLFLIPWTISFVVTAVTWQWLLNAQYGLLNAILRHFGLISANITWLGSATLAMPSAIAVNVWRGYPFAMVMIYAGLQLIPEDQYEAALVDGASRLQLFRYITLPNLRGTIVTTTVLDMIWVFTQFDLIQVLTAGGPARKTELLTNLIYRVSFSFYDFGAGSAIATIMLVVVLVMSLIYVRALEARV